MNKKQSSFTLMEMVVVIGIIAISVGIIVGIATHISNQSKKQFTKNTFALLNSALGQFRDYEYRYNYKAPPIATFADANESNFYRGLDFPLDCNGLPQLQLEITLARTLGTTKIIPFGVHDPNHSGSEALYFFLNRVPTSRQTLDRIDESLITNLSSDKRPMKIIINRRTHSLLRIIDPWGTTLHYDYHPDWADYKGLDGLAGYFGYADKSKRTFPEIISAGPDRVFGTGDDITNR